MSWATNPYELLPVGPAACNVSSPADEDMADEDVTDEDMADEDMTDEDMADEDATYSERLF